MNSTMTLVRSFEFSPTERRRRHDCTRFVPISTRRGARTEMVGVEFTSELDRGLSRIFRRERQEGFFQRSVYSALLAQFIARSHRDQLAMMHNADAVSHLFRDTQLVR